MDLLSFHLKVATWVNYERGLGSKVDFIHAIDYVLKIITVNNNPTEIYDVLVSSNSRFKKIWYYEL